MNISHDQLKDAYRGRVQDRLPDSRSSCPEPTKLWRFFSARSSRKSKRKILDHIAQCGLCATDFEMFMEIDRASKEFIRSLEHRFPHRRRKQSLFIHPGFLPTWEFTLIGLGLFFLTLSLLSTIPHMIRPEASLNPIRALETRSVRLIQPIGLTQSSPNIKFIWTTDDPVEYSTIELFDDSLAFLWKSPPIKTLFFSLPLESAAPIQPERKYFWLVRVHSRNFPPLESDLKEFTIVRD